MSINQTSDNLSEIARITDTARDGNYTSGQLGFRGSILTYETLPYGALYIEDATGNNSDMLDVNETTYQEVAAFIRRNINEWGV